MSPVPGGRSTTSTSSGAASSPQRTSSIIWRTAEETIGPRQIIARPSSTMKPIDITFTPNASSGISLPSSKVGLSVRPIMRGAEGP